MATLTDAQANRMMAAATEQITALLRGLNRATPRSCERAALRVAIKRAARRAQAAGTITETRAAEIIEAVNETRNN